MGHASPDDDCANYEKLGKILKSNCISHPPHDCTWGGVSHVTNWDHRLETEQLIVPWVTCYADIPVQALSIHLKKYGKFGVALPRSLLTKYGARPVMYIPMRSDDWESINGLTLLRDIEAIVKGFHEHVVDKQGAESKSDRTLGEKPNTPETAIFEMESMTFKDFLAFIKPFNSELADDHPSNFYLEREWRKYGNMKFEITQISTVVVAKGYAERVARDFPMYKGRTCEI